MGDVFIILYHPFGTRKDEESVFFTLSAWRRQCCALVIEQVSHLSTVPAWIINIECAGAGLRFKGDGGRLTKGGEKREGEHTLFTRRLTGTTWPNQRQTQWQVELTGVAHVKRMCSSKTAAALGKVCVLQGLWVYVIVRTAFLLHCMIFFIHISVPTITITTDKVTINTETHTHTHTHTHSLVMLLDQMCDSKQEREIQCT